MLMSSVSTGIRILAIIGTVLAGQTSVAEETVVATVDDLAITLSQVEQSASLDLKDVRSPSKKREILQEKLDDLIADRLQRVAAREINVMDRIKYRVRRRRMLSETALSLFQDEVIVPRLQCDSVDADTFYQNHPELFIIPEERRWVRYIMSYRDNEGARRMKPEYIDTLLPEFTPKQRSDSAYTLLRAGRDWDRVSFEFNEDPNVRRTAGNLGWVENSQGAFPETFRRVVFSAPLGKISEPVELPAGWAIIHVTDTMGAGIAEFTPDLRQKVLSDLSLAEGKQIAEAYVDSVVKAKGLRIDQIFLQTPVDQIPEGVPMAFVGVDTLFTDEYLQFEKSARKRRPDVPPEDRLVLLRNLAKNIAMWSAMSDMGFADSSEIRKIGIQLDQEESYVRLAEKIENDPSGPPRPTQEDIEKYYEEHLNEFRGTKPVRTTVARFTSLEDAKKAADLVNSGTSLEDAAEQFDGALDPPKWVGQDEVSEKLFSQLLNMEVGSSTEAISGSVGAYIARLDQLANVFEFNRVRASIEAQLKEKWRRDRIQAWAEKAKRRYPVKIHQSVWREFLDSLAPRVGA